jgi:hypothetical protein
MKYKSLALAAAALMAGTLTFGGAQAANVMTGSGAPAGITKLDDGNVQQASHRKWRWRHRHRDRSGIFLGLGFAPFFSPYYHRPYYYDDPYYYDTYVPVRSSAHVRSCLRRYITYNPRTNLFRGYDGRLHPCRSPYRY